MLSSLIALLMTLSAILTGGKYLPDCDDIDNAYGPCYTVDDGWERIVLSYHPYAYVNIGKEKD